MTTMTLKVAGTSVPAKVATSIVKNIQEGNDVETISIGAGALNQAVKAIAIARGLAAPQGWDLTVRPGFLDLTIDGEIKTALRLLIIK
jgi:stage V sporulation protein S